MSADPHPGLRAAADLLYLVNEGVQAVLIGSGEAMINAIAPSVSAGPALRLVTTPASVQERQLPRRSVSL